MSPRISLALSTLYFLVNNQLLSKSESGWDYLGNTSRSPSMFRMASSADIFWPILGRSRRKAEGTLCADGKMCVHGPVETL